MDKREDIRFILTEDIIKREAKDQQTYREGKRLYFDKGIQFFAVNLEDYNLLGRVKDGNLTYVSEICFNRSGVLDRYGCTCNEFKRSAAACLHIISMMQATYGYLGNIAYFIKDRNRSKRHNLNISKDPYMVLSRVDSLGLPSEIPNTIPVTTKNNADKKYIDDYKKQSEHKINKIIDKPGFLLDIKSKELFKELSKVMYDNLDLKDTDKQEVKLIPIYNFIGNYEGVTHLLEFITGTDKTYVVKNVVEYINCIVNNKPLKFGVNFTFDAENMGFSAVAQQIIDFLIKIFIDNKQLTVYNRNYSAPYRSERQVRLSNSRVLEFFDIMSEHQQPFNANLKNITLENTVIRMEAPDIKMKLSKIEKGLRLSFDISKEDIYKLDYEGKYIYYNQNIYKLSFENNRILSTIIDYLKDSKKPEMLIPEEEVSRFYSIIIPSIKKVGSLSIQKDIDDRYVKKELSTRIYFDKDENRNSEGIRARIEFNYADIIFTPSESNNIYDTDGKIIIRDEAQEKHIEKIFKKAGFTKSNDVFLLSDEELIFFFIKDILPELKDIAEIYYSEAFKTVRIDSSINFKASVGLSRDSKMLEFTLDHEGIDVAELKKLLKSYRIKKKYYRLKKGAFLSLDNDQVSAIAQLINKLNLSDNDFKEEVLELPAFKAMYLDSITREIGDLQIQRSAQFKKLVQNITEPQDIEYEVPDSLKDILRDYQKTGFRWLKVLSEYGFGGILADDMGLGKTLQVIVFLLYEKLKYRIKPSIVIAPTSLVYNWQAEVAKFTSELSVAVISGPINERKQQLEDSKTADMIVTSYGLIKRDIAFYRDMEFSYCFLDEAQNIKNPSTLNARTVKKIKSKSKFVLTGTPIENSLTELWSIFDFIMPGYLLSHSRFVKEYENPIIKNQDQDALKELGRHIKPFILRRMKKDVLSELPDKTEIRVVCTLEEQQKDAYMAYLMKAKNIFENEIMVKGFEKNHIKILAMLTRLRQICCHPSLFIENYKGGSGKMELFLELLSNAIESGHRVLVFSQFTGMLALVRKELEDREIDYFYLDGSTASYTRIEQVNSFNEGNKKVFLISLKAGGTGLNLTGADTVIHLDPWWNPAVEDQATDRAHRIGQKNAVTVYKLVTKGTIEEKIYELQNKKKELIDSIIKPGENFLTKMNAEEVRSLFKL